MGTLLAAREAKAVVAGRAGDPVDAGILDALKNVGIGTAVGEVATARDGLFGSKERSVDQEAIVSPAGVPERGGEAVGFADRSVGVGELGVDRGDLERLGQGEVGSTVG